MRKTKDYVEARNEAFATQLATINEKIKSYNYADWGIDAGDLSRLNHFAGQMYKANKLVAAIEEFKRDAVKLRHDLRFGKMGEKIDSLTDAVYALIGAPAKIEIGAEEFYRYLYRKLKNSGLVSDAELADLGFTGAEIAHNPADEAPAMSELKIVGEHVRGTVSKKHHQMYRVHVKRGDAEPENLGSFTKRHFIDGEELPAEAQEWVYTVYYVESDVEVGQPSLPCSVLVKRPDFV